MSKTQSTLQVRPSLHPLGIGVRVRTTSVNRLIVHVLLRERSRFQVRSPHASTSHTVVRSFSVWTKLCDVISASAEFMVSAAHSAWSPHLQCLDRVQRGHPPEKDPREEETPEKHAIDHAYAGCNPRNRGMQQHPPLQNPAQTRAPYRCLSLHLLDWLLWGGEGGGGGGRERRGDRRGRTRHTVVGSVLNVRIICDS
jgi:hypothetical protein